MEISRSCAVRPLVAGPLCRVDACGCGTLHVSVGIFTLRLKPRAARELAESLLAALEESLESQAEDRGTRPLC